MQNDEHLCLIAVIGVERPDISRHLGGDERESLDWNLTCVVAEWTLSLLFIFVTAVFATVKALRAHLLFCPVCALIK